MSFFYATEDEKRIASQSVQNRYVRIELYGFNFVRAGVIEGVATSGSITIDANSDLRRSGNMTLVVKGQDFEIKPNKKIWMNRLVKISVGTYDYRSAEISWTNCGFFIIDAPSYSYDDANNTLSFSMLDMMARFTGARGGYLKGIPTVLKAGEKIKDVMISILEMAEIKKYEIQDPPEPGLIPFDLEFGQGTTIYQLLKALLDIYPNYEMFFDEDGVFTYQRIPSGEFLPISLDDEFWKIVCTNEAVTVDFQNVKNSIEVYGRTHDPEYFSATTEVVGQNIKLTIPEVVEYSENIIYGFTLSNPVGANSTLSINDLPPKPILENGKSIVNTPEQEETYYCVQYKADHWEWLGHLQAYGTAEDDNPDSPFYIKGPTGVIRLPLFGDEYENIFSDDLAKQRAKYELFLHANMNDSITLTCIPVYWLDVNVLTEYTPRRDKSDKGLFLIKSITYGLGVGDNMTVNMIRDYEVEVPDGGCSVLWNHKDTPLLWNKQNKCRVVWH